MRCLKYDHIKRLITKGEDGNDHINQFSLYLLQDQRKIEKNLKCIAFTNSIKNRAKCVR